MFATKRGFANNKRGKASSWQEHKVSGVDPLATRPRATAIIWYSLRPAPACYATCLYIVPYCL